MNCCRWTDGKITGRLFPARLKRASAIIAQNEHQRTGMQSLYGHNAILIRSIYPFPPDAAPGADGILWVGRCKQVKSPERFLDLAAALPDVRFTMVALPTAEEPEFFASLAERAAALPNLEWVPGATTAEMPAIYGRHAVLVNTSDHEGVPNTFIEAAAHGLAIVSLSVDPDAILSKENAGICCGGDRTRLIEAVRRLATDRAQCRQMGSRARTVFRRLYDAENVLPAYAELIRHLAAGARVNRA